MIKFGRILKSLSGFYYIKDERDGLVYQTRARGNFRQKGTKPIVGDFAEFSAEENSEGYVLALKARENMLVRPPIANIDQAVVVISAIEPNFSLNLLDRFLVLLTNKGIYPLIYLSKLDLVPDLAVYEKTRDEYEKIGYKFFMNDWQKILPEFSSKVTVFMGQTGVGKSTLLNKIAPEMLLATQEISDKLGRGRHTTRHVELFEVHDGLIADTPGFSSLDYEIDNQPDLNAAFPEILPESFGCKFRECTHTHEPKCQVKPAVESGEILQSRYDNYLLFLAEIQGKRETYKKVVKK
ncbi:ribosome small subunit-dependent GTPase A [Lactococcus raffinolactis]|uniref:Small ribosomal subunit biogenesis GTPase RsgA n=1 Tax=Pseudolactococcus raffinolactis TaxID=1366 RepID=A0A6H0UDB0_9LACT|nr:ribosome small subunit-dependent GTPase A [Lactococcus raffinolactis]QIW53346.1 ribosome small subunit-dependent GTPase A [Lactococcus raffinolactis]